MKYSPKLKTAMEEIKAVIAKYDIAGVVVLHTPGFSEYYKQISPSYSCAFIRPNPQRVEIQGKLIHYGGDREKQVQMLTDTTNMLHHLSHITGEQALELLQVSEMADKMYGAEYGPGGHSSNEEVSN